MKEARQKMLLTNKVLNKKKMIEFYKIAAPKKFHELKSGAVNGHAPWKNEFARMIQMEVAGFSLIWSCSKRSGSCQSIAVHYTGNEQVTGVW